jgi:hypothetical protein
VGEGVAGEVIIFLSYLKA